MNIASLSPQQLRRAADLKERIDALQAEYNKLLGIKGKAVQSAAPELPKNRRRKRRKMSPQGLANIRAGVAKRMGRRGRKAPAAPSAQAKASPAKGSGEITVKAAILKALEGQALSKRDLADKVSALRGKKTNPNTLSPTLNEMKKKDKTISNPERGLYKLK